MDDTAILWTAFNVFVLGMLALDLGVFHKKSEVISVKDALIWTGIWITLAMGFNFFVYQYFGKQEAIEFFTGYIIEKSLSVDNIFVIIMIFSYFHVPPSYQHKVLFWGILGPLAMRVIFILKGAKATEATKGQRENPKNRKSNGQRTNFNGPISMMPHVARRAIQFQVRAR